MAGGQSLSSSLSSSSGGGAAGSSTAGLMAAPAANSAAANAAANSMYENFITIAEIQNITGMMRDGQMRMHTLWDALVFAFECVMFARIVAMRLTIRVCNVSFSYRVQTSSER
jgi:hypothetical protein